MNLFNQELEKRDLQYILGDNQFIPIAPRNSDKFAAMVQHVVSNNLRVYIDPDCDPDGYFSARIIKGMFDRIGYTNYGIGRHDHKRHKLRQAYIGSLIDQGYQAFIIVDSSTNDMQFLTTLYLVGAWLLALTITLLTTSLRNILRE